MSREKDRLFRTVPVRSPTSTAPLLAGQGDLTDCRRAGLPVRPRPAASCQPDRVEERHPLRRDQDRPRQAQNARLLACISTRILSVPLERTGQIGDDFSDRNQLGVLRLHGFILPCPSDKTGTPLPTTLKIRSMRHNASRTAEVSVEGFARDPPGNGTVAPRGIAISGLSADRQRPRRAGSDI